MRKLIYFLLCDNVIEDAERKVSIIGIFNQLRVREFPSTATRFVVAFNFDPDSTDIVENKIDAKIQIFSTSEMIIEAEQTGKVETDFLDSGNKEVAGAFDFSGKITFETPGEYTAKLFIADNKIADLQFKVKKIRG
jgi:uncharacterized protein DUF6941